jgi:hypothetical protein
MLARSCTRISCTWHVHAAMYVRRRCVCACVCSCTCAHVRACVCVCSPEGGVVGVEAGQTEGGRDGGRDSGIHLPVPVQKSGPSSRIQKG